MHFMRNFLCSAFMLLSLGACAHHHAPAARYDGPIVERRPSPCKGGVWVERHQRANGTWRESYWRCPGVRVIDPD